MTEIGQATRDLIAAMNEGQRVVCIHYSSESFYEVLDRPVAITAIGVTELTDPTGENTSQVFSLANSSENHDVIKREKDMLDRFFQFAKSRPNTYWAHWNMNNATYGFAAITSRYRYLFELDPPNVWQTERLYDLDAIVAARYGQAFAKHPKLKSLCTLNNYFLSFFSDGKDEAQAFTQGDFGLCERSASTKAVLLSSILTDFRLGRLKTANSVGVVEFAGGHLDAVKVVLELGHKFLYVERELKRRHSNRSTLLVKDEYDSQDLLRAMLAVFFADVRPEDAVQAFAGGNSRIDFVLPEFKLAIELKFTRESMTTKNLGEELIIDRERYAQRKDVQHLLCLVFDHEGRIVNPRGVEKDLGRDSTTESFAVTVRIYDR